MLSSHHANKIMSIQWSKEYETGHEIVDREHKDIFALVQMVFDISPTSRKEKIDEAISFLAEYTVRHFQHEEGLMTLSNYPDTKSHIQQHNDFIKSVTALQERVRDEGNTMRVHLDVNQTVVDWLVTHVLDSDKIFADHYKAWKKKTVT